MSDIQAIVSRVDLASIDQMRDLDVEDVYVQMDALLQERPGPLDLYRRWERQQWSAEAIDLDEDRSQWDRFDAGTKMDFESFFAGFFVGEQAVTDTLSPLLIGAPDEASRIFLATQIVDEARHSYFFARYYMQVLGVADTFEGALRYAESWTVSPVFRDVFDNHLTSATESVRADPDRYDLWVAAVTMYHFMVEGILALTGQKMMLRMLRRFNLLPGFRAGFTAVTRDESRHVNYGVWALSKAVADGHGGVIQRTVDASLRSCMWIYANPDYRLIVPEGLPPEARVDPRTNWSFALDSLVKRLRAVGMEASYLERVQADGWRHVWEAIAEYEDRYAEEHPVRQWERGEVA